MNPRQIVPLALAVPMALYGSAASALNMEERMELMEGKMKQMEGQLESTRQENAKLKQQLAEKLPRPATGSAEEGAVLNAKLASLEKRVEQDKKAADEAAKNAPKFEVGRNGVTFKSADENYKLRLSGYAQADARFFADNTTLGSDSDAAHAVNDQFLIRRARLTLDGSLFKMVDFRLSPDFAGSTLRLFDAFVDLHYFDYAALMGGKMRQPVSLERYQTAPNLTFIERGYPAETAPNRDVGLMLHGQIPYPGYKTQYTMQPMFKEFLSYELGVFNGTRDNQAVQNSESDKDNNKELAARVFAHPFLHAGIPALEGLGFGVAGTWGRPKNNNMPSLVSVGQNTIVTYTGGGGNTLATGESYRIYPQMYWYWGSFGLLGEYVLSSQDLQGSYVQAGKTKTAEARAQNDAWQVQASYVLTGEKASFFGVKPAQNFDPFNGGWGALQLAARWTELDIDNSVFQNYGSKATPFYVFSDPRQSVSKASTWSLGLNWILNNNVKIAANYDQTSFKGGAGAGNTYLSRDMEKVFMTRFQFQF